MILRWKASPEEGVVGRGSLTASNISQGMPKGGARQRPVISVVSERLIT